MLNLESLRQAGAGLVDQASSTFSRFTRVEELTSPKDYDSLPVYALNELVQECNKRPEDARSVATLLLRKVMSSHSVVKWKALRAIRYICQNSSNQQFKKACGGTNATPIRAALTWTSSPHPQLGQALNVRVRDAAREALDEVFKISPLAESGNQGLGSVRSRIQGYGSTTGAKIHGAAAPDPPSVTLTGTTRPGKYTGFGSEDVRAAEVGGGTWREAAAGQHSDGGQASVSAHHDPTAGPLDASLPSVSAAREALGDEARVVQQLCSNPGGLRALPTEEHLATFVRAASQLDGDMVALELSHQLVNAAWQARLRALAGIEAVARAAHPGAPALTGAVGQLRSVPDLFAPSLTHTNPAIKSAAQRATAALGISAQCSAAPPLAPTASPDAQGVGGDLLGDARPAGTAASPDVDLLGDLMGGAAVATAVEVQLADGGCGGAAADQAGVLDGLDAITGAPDGRGDAEVADMFAGLAVAAAPGAASEPVGNLVDLLDDVPGPMHPAVLPASAVPLPSTIDGLLHTEGDLMLADQREAGALSPEQRSMAPSNASPFARLPAGYKEHGHNVVARSLLSGEERVAASGYGHTTLVGPQIDEPVPSVRNLATQKSQSRTLPQANHVADRSRDAFDFVNDVLRH